MALMRPFRARAALALSAVAAVALLGACAIKGPRPAPATAAEAGPAPGAADAAPVAVMDIGGARRCMDTLLQDQGPRELALLVEEGGDRSGARELLVSSISDMTQRSRTVRVVQGRSADGTVPPVAVRAAFADAGRASIAIDASLVFTRDQSVVPGSAARTTSTLNERAGLAEIRKAGRTVGVALKGDPRTQAERAVADVAAIELLGRAARVPYWRCVGAPATDPAIAAEIQSWYDAMATRPAEIIAWFQQQLALRQAYDGPVDGLINQPLKEAVVRYRAALGLSHEPKLSLDFFQAWLDADHPTLAAQVVPAAFEPAAPAASPSALPTPPPRRPVPATLAAAPLQLKIGSASDSPRLARGAPLQLNIQPSRDAHVYCFHQDEQRRITRFFPNRFRSDSRVGAARGMQLPGAMRFEIVPNAEGAPETVACFATEEDVMDRLPATLSAADFTPLPLATLEQVRAAFQKSADGRVAVDTLLLRTR